MQQPKRDNKTMTIRRGRYLVEVPIEVTHSPEDPDEPIIDAQTAKLLDEIARHAAAGDVPWLKQHGRVYELTEV